MDETPLQRIGLTQGEIKVYRALLRLGTTTAGPIAQEAGVARSKLYDILERLAQKGLASHSVHNGTKQFSATEPARLLDFLRQKEEDIKVQQESIKQMLPQLEAEYELKEITQEAEVFEGLEGLKNVREEYVKKLKKGDAIYFFSVPATAIDRLEGYYTDWNQRRIKKGIASYTVLTHECHKIPYFQKKQSHSITYVRYLAPGIPMYSWAEIYGDTVVIAINYKKPMSIVIHNKYVAASYKQHFQLLWNLSKE